MQNRPPTLWLEDGLQTTQEGIYQVAKKTLAVVEDKTWGDALFHGSADSGTQEWHDLRKAGIGGSDIAAICKVSPWASPWSVWARKTGLLEDTSGGSEAMEWGTRLESVILDRFSEDHPDLTVHRNVGTWRHSERPWQLANPDAIYSTGTDQGIIEVKTSRFEDDWANGVPAYYRTQVQWYLQTFGFKHAYVIVLFGGQKYREFEIHAEEFEQEANLTEAEKLWHLVQSGEQPEFDGAMATLETVRQLHPSIDPEGECDLGDLYVHYMISLGIEAEAVARSNEMKSRIIDAMGDAKRGLFEDKWVLTRQSRNGGTPFLVQKKG